MSQTGDREYHWENIVRCVVRNGRFRHPKNMDGCSYWHFVAEMCGLGSTSAIELCRRFDINPHEALPRSGTY